MNAADLFVWTMDAGFLRYLGSIVLILAIGVAVGLALCGLPSRRS